MRMFFRAPRNFRGALFLLDVACRPELSRNKKKRGANSCAPFSFCKAKKISAKSQAAHRKKQLRSGEFHPDRATSRWEPRARIVGSHRNAPLCPARPAKDQPCQGTAH